ncbi:UPF0149 family protein [Aeromonas caviae]|uniref:UPF0149 family protein n=1 Tax=Aeromonas TaxID=642 RepID=UPI0022E34F46|nr:MULTISPECIES: UPF0149 family protein [Aeromonas]MEB5774082.1 UPF0149 family protein [Aeromonas caviae]MEB6649348.1 UPF0149 family protein [Aeromonas caviae]
MKKITIHPLTESETEWLEQRLLDYGDDDSVLTLSELDGFLAAIVTGPELVPISRWWPILWGGGVEPKWQSEREMKRAIELILGHMNLLAHTLCNQPDNFEPLLMVNPNTEPPVEIAEEWCFGYLRGVALGNWPELPEELDTWLEVIRLHGSDDEMTQLASLSLEEHQQTVAEVGPAALRLHAHFLAQRQPVAPPSPVIASPKVGRNDPCPCGSGKKFKQCCLH